MISAEIVEHSTLHLDLKLEEGSNTQIFEDVNQAEA